MNVGFVVGKFYPPHAGHHYLIDTALEECDKVVVLVAWSSIESITGFQRVEWLKKRHPDAVVLNVMDNFPVDYNNDEAWDNHVNLFSTTLARWEVPNNYQVNRFYSSELWGAQMAEMLSGRDGRGDVDNKMVDVNRLTFPISATLVRDDPKAVWEYLSPPVRADLCKRVVILGGESTGTTTLAKALAIKLETVVVPEMGRHFDWAVGKHHKWTTEDFIEIAEEQVHWENMMAYKSGPILICDTDTFATEMFHEIYLDNNISEELGNITHNHRASHEAALYIITDHIGVEFEDDGTRWNSGKRPWATQWLEGMLRTDMTIKVTGSHEERMEQALAEINDLTWDYAKPLEYR